MNFEMDSDYDTVDCGDDLIEQACLYITEKKYRYACSMTTKQQIRYRPKTFRLSMYNCTIVDVQLYYSRCTTVL